MNRRLESAAWNLDCTHATWFSRFCGSFGITGGVHWLDCSELTEGEVQHQWKGK